MASYSTTFSATENPLSESGVWTNGKVTGVDWQNMQSNASGNAVATAFNTVGLYDDNIAILSGFSPSHYIEGIVYRAGGYSPTTAHEIELFLLGTITAHSIKGYEILLNSAGSNQIVRWNGTAGDFTVLSPAGAGPGTPADGDVIRAVSHVSGSTVKINVYKNNALVWTLTDSSAGAVLTGSPGIAAFTIGGGDSVLASFGWKSIEADNALKVGYVGTAQATPGTGSSIAVGLTVDGENPCIVGKFWVNSTTATVNSVSWGPGSGTPVKVKETRSSNGCLVSVWEIPTPTAGAGTLTATLSASVLSGGAGAVWNDVANPACPTGDAASSNTTATTTVLTPTNLTAKDASDGAAANIIGGSYTTGSPNQRFLDFTDDPGYLVVDATGTTGLTFTNDGTVPAGDMAVVAVRVKALALQVPVITQNPTDSTVSDGTTATFTVAATFYGTGSSYQWQDNRTGSFTNVSGGTGDTTASYTTAATSQLFVGRRYQCVVTDSNGSATSTTARLFVNNWSLILWDTSVQSGNDVWLRDPTLTAGASPDVTKALTGINSPGTLGTLTPSSSVPITGVNSTGSIGTLVPVISIPLTGISSTGSIGSLTPSTSVPLTGVTSTGSIGTLSPVITVPLTGVSSLGALGTLTPSTATDITVAATGVNSNGALGTVVPSADIPLSGVNSSGTTGTLSPVITVALTGVSSSGALGSMTANPDVLLALTGINSPGALGTLSVDMQIPLSGVNSDGVLGVLVAPGDVTVALTGVSSEGILGNLIPVITPDDLTILAGSGHPGSARFAATGIIKKKRFQDLLNVAIKDVYEGVVEDSEPKIRKQAAKIVRPFIEKGTKPSTIPVADTIDWVALEKDANKVSALLDLLKSTLDQQQRDIEDEEIAVIMALL